MIKDDAGDISDHVYGKYSLVKDVKRKALRFDGFCIYISRENDMPRIAGSFTLGAWIAFGVYPSEKNQGKPTLLQIEINAGPEHPKANGLLLTGVTPAKITDTTQQHAAFLNTRRMGI